MPLVVNATPKSTTANSYVTRARADEILDARLYATDWTGATDANKDRAIVWATELLDGLMEWNGIITEPGTWNGTEQVGIQALRWPRYPVATRDGYGYLNKDTIPLDIERATAELALVLLGSDRFAAPSLLGLGFKEAAVGSLRVTVDTESTATTSVIPDNIQDMVAYLGKSIPQAINGTKLNKVVRA